jgi:hypothetical protein
MPLYTIYREKRKEKKTDNCAISGLEKHTGKKHVDIPSISWV